MPRLVLLASTEAHMPVVTRKNPTASEAFAADELRRYLRRITGQPLATRGYATLPGRIVLNDPDAARADGVKHAVESLSGDAFILNIADKAVHVLARNDRGVLYGTYEILRRLGVRWFTPEVERVPSLAEAALPATSGMVRPAFEYRDVLNEDCADPLWRVRNRLNGHFSPIPAYLGGHIRYGLHVHTFYALVPPDRHFATHPEYFSMQNGVRTWEGGQLCLTNPEVKRLAVESILERIRQNPDSRIFSVSQNDWHGYCECPECAALVEKEGAQSGPVVHFANAVADAVGKVHPDVLISTLAYAYTVEAPKHVVPHKNVRIRLCPIGCCQGHAFGSCDHPKSAQFLTAFKKWSRMTDQLYIWHYGTNFTNMMLPMPNFDELADNFAFYHKNHVHGVFLQGGSEGGFGAESLDLRGYLTGELLWNPEQPVWTLVQEWLDAVHGKAAPLVRQYYDLFHNYVRTHRAMHPVCYAHPDDALMNPAVIKKADAALAKAEKISDGRARLRIRSLRAGLAVPALQRGSGNYRIKGSSYVGDATPQDVRAYDAMVRDWKAFGIQSQSEGRMIDDSVHQFRSRLQAHPVLWLKDAGQRMAIVPNLGGRLVEWHAHGRQWLAPADPENRWQAYPFSGGGCEFAITGVYGFEGWMTACEAQTTTKGIRLAANLRCGLRFERTLSLRNGALRIDSVVTNPGGSARRFVWDASLQWRLPDWTAFSLDGVATCAEAELPAGLEKARAFVNAGGKPGAWALRGPGYAIRGAFTRPGMATCYLGKEPKGALVSTDLRSARIALAKGERFAMTHIVRIAQE